jgi:hypothetical protein
MSTDFMRQFRVALESLTSESNRDANTDVRENPQKHPARHLQIEPSSLPSGGDLTARLSQVRITNGARSIHRGQVQLDRSPVDVRKLRDQSRPQRNGLLGESPLLGLINPATIGRLDANRFPRPRC